MLWGRVIQKLLNDNWYPSWLSQSLPLTFIPILPTLAVDYSYPCWTKQGGEVMQEKTENQIDKNYFVWDTAYYRWKCAATSTSCSNFVLGIVVTTVLQQLWNLMWFVGCGLWNNGVPHDHTKQNRLSMIQKMKKGGDGFQKTSSILLVLCVHTHMCLLQTGRPVWYTHAHFQNSMLNVQKLHVPGYCRFMTGTFLRDCVLHVHFVSGLGGRILDLVVHTQVNTELCCVWYLYSYGTTHTPR